MWILKIADMKSTGPVDAYAAMKLDEASELFADVTKTATSYHKWNIARFYAYLCRAVAKRQSC